jgi:hypothetical protein
MNPVQTLMKPVQVFTKSVHMFREEGYWVLGKYGMWDIGYYAQGRLLLETWNMRRYSI